MAVTVTLFAVIFGLAYLMKIDSGYMKEGAIIGILWLAISIVIDLFMFSWGPMAMPFVEYMEDIGLTYLIYPIVTIGMGYVLEKRAVKR